MGGLSVDFYLYDESFICTQVRRSETPPLQGEVGKIFDFVRRGCILFAFVEVAVTVVGVYHADGLQI